MGWLSKAKSFVRKLISGSSGKQPQAPDPTAGFTPANYTPATQTPSAGQSTANVAPAGQTSAQAPMSVGSTSAPTGGFTPAPTAAPQEPAPAGATAPTAPMTAAPTQQAGGMTQAPTQPMTLMERGEQILGSINEVYGQIPRFEVTSGADIMPGTGVIGRVGQAGIKAGQAGIQVGAKALGQESIDDVLKGILKKRGGRISKYRASLKARYDKIISLGGQVLDGTYKSDDALKSAGGKLLTPKNQQGKYLDVLAKVPNPKKEKLAFDYLGKVVSGFKNPKMVAGIIASFMGGATMGYIMTPNTKSDIVRDMNIAQNDALEVGDYDTVDWTNEVLNELNEPSVINWLETNAPLINWPIHEVKRFKNALEVSNRATARSQEARVKEEEAGMMTYLNPEYGTPQYWAKKEMEDDMDAQLFHERALERINLENEIWDQNQQDREDWDRQLRIWAEEDQDMWDDIRDEDERIREADKVYWETVRAQDEAIRLAEQAYWEEVREGEGDREPSRLGFGLF